MIKNTSVSVRNGFNRCAIVAIIRNGVMVYSATPDCTWHDDQLIVVSVQGIPNGGVVWTDTVDIERESVSDRLPKDVRHVPVTWKQLVEVGRRVDVTITKAVTDPR